MPTYTTFEELDCYKKCRDLRIWVHQFLRKAQIRDRDLIQNIKRASRSTTRNVAEGFGRHHPKENIQFCRIAVGSIHEVLDDLNIITDDNLSTPNLVTPGKILSYKALKSLRSYIAYLQRRA